MLEISEKERDIWLQKICELRDTAVKALSGAATAEMQARAAKEAADRTVRELDTLRSLFSL